VKNGIDWYKLVHIESPIKPKDQLIYVSLHKYIDDSKDSLLDNIFRSTITVFR
jgi:hypothetical protein